MNTCNLFPQTYFKKKHFAENNWGYLLKENQWLVETDKIPQKNSPANILSDNSILATQAISCVKG